MNDKTIDLVCFTVVLLIGVIVGRMIGYREGFNSFPKLLSNHKVRCVQF